MAKHFLKKRWVITAGALILTLGIGSAAFAVTGSPAAVPMPAVPTIVALAAAPATSTTALAGSTWGRSNEGGWQNGTVDRARDRRDNETPLAGARCAGGRDQIRGGGDNSQADLGNGDRDRARDGSCGHEPVRDGSGRDQSRGSDRDRARDGSKCTTPSTVTASNSST